MFDLFLAIIYYYIRFYFFIFLQIYVPILPDYHLLPLMHY